MQNKKHIMSEQLKGRSISSYCSGYCVKNASININIKIFNNELRKMPDKHQNTKHKIVFNVHVCNV